MSDTVWEWGWTSMSGSEKPCNFCDVSFLIGDDNTANLTVWIMVLMDLPFALAGCLLFWSNGCLFCGQGTGSVFYLGGSWAAWGWETTISVLVSGSNQVQTEMGHLMRGTLGIKRIWIKDSHLIGQNAWSGITWFTFCCYELWLSRWKVLWEEVCVLSSAYADDTKIYPV